MAFSSARVARGLMSARQADRKTAASGRPLLLSQPGGLTPQVAQVVQLRAAHPAELHDLDLVDDRRMQRKDPLDPLSEGHLADRERRPRTAAANPDDKAFEDLNSLLVTLANLDVNANGVAGPEIRPLDQL